MKTKSRAIIITILFAAIFALMTVVGIAVFKPQALPLWLDPRHDEVAKLIRVWKFPKDTKLLEKHGCVAISILTEEKVLAIAREIPHSINPDRLESSRFEGRFTYPLKSPPVENLKYDNDSNSFVNMHEDKFFIGYDKEKFALYSWPRLIGYEKFGAPKYEKVFKK